MNAFEVNALLVSAGQIDARMRRTNTVERADMAEAWAGVLADVSAEDAAWALNEHYKGTRESVMPADIIELVASRNPERLSSWAGNITEQRLAAEAAGVRKALEPGDV